LGGTQEMDGRKRENRLSRMVERTRPEAAAKTRRTGGSGGFGVAAPARRPRPAKPSLSDEEQLLIEIVTRGV